MEKIRVPIGNIVGYIIMFAFRILYYTLYLRIYDVLLGGYAHKINRRLYVLLYRVTYIRIYE